jgi:hypothetical protein
MSNEILGPRRSPSDRVDIDPRGPQFTAALTAVLLAAVLLTAPGTVGLVLLGIQAGLFALGAAVGVQHTPHAWLFRRLVRPRLAPPAELEDATPPRFAQAVGLVFAAAGLLGYIAGSDIAGAIAVGFALVAALLNAVFRFCLGCEVYLLLARTLNTTTTATH